MAQITQRSGNWFVRIRKSGHHVSKTFQLKRNAESFARETERAIERGEYGEDRHTLADAIDSYISDCEANRIKGRKSQPKALQTSNRSKLAFWRSHLGQFDVGQLKADHLRRTIDIHLRNRVAESGRYAGAPITGATINRYVSEISAVLTYAIRREWIASNVARNIDKENESGRPTAEQINLTHSEVESLLGYCANESINLHLFTLIAYETGCRTGELQKLRWDDVDLAACHMLLRDTKNGKDRPVPLSARTVEILRARKTELRARLLQTPGIPSAVDSLDRVFTPARVCKNGIWEYRRQWHRARESAGLPGYEFKWFRNLFVTRASAAGVPPLQIAEIVGHSSLAMVQHYARHSVSHLGDAMAKING